MRIYTEENLIGLVKNEVFRSNVRGFLMVFSGEIKISDNNAEVVLSKGDFLPIMPDNYYKVLHHTHQLKLFIVVRDVDSAISISLNINRYDIYRFLQFLNSRVINIPDDEMRKCFSIISFLKEYSERDDVPYSTDIRNSLILSFAYIILSVQNGITQQKQPYSRSEEITMSFLKIVQKNFKNEKELPFYAEQLHISVKYLAKCVRETTSESPTKFINDVLLSEARKLLLNTHDNISQIAYQLGFADQFSFGKFFKKHSGLSPKNFRIENRTINSI